MSDVLENELECSDCGGNMECRFDMLECKECGKGEDVQ